MQFLGSEKKSTNSYKEPFALCNSLPFKANTQLGK